jgi:TolB protein
VTRSHRRLDRIAASVLLCLALVAAGCAGDDDTTAPPGGSQGQPAISRDGDWLAFTDDGIHVERLGSPAARITDPGGDTDRYPAWSPDGSRLVFARVSDAVETRGLYVVRRDGTGLRRLTRGDDAAPAWSPDGRRIAFARSDELADFEPELRVVDPDGRHDRLLLRDAQDPAWSPDGAALAFVRGAMDVIGVLDLGTGRTRRVLRVDRFALRPAWSPDGRLLAFEDYAVPSEAAYVIGIPEISVVGVDGGGRRRLTTDTYVDYGPAWLPDGRIAFASNRDGAGRIWVMEADGSGLDRLR